MEKRNLKAADFWNKSEFDYFEVYGCECQAGNDSYGRSNEEPSRYVK